MVSCSSSRSSRNARSPASRSAAASRRAALSEAAQRLDRRLELRDLVGRLCERVLHRSVALDDRGFEPPAHRIDALASLLTLSLELRRGALAFREEPRLVVFELDAQRVDGLTQLAHFGARVPQVAFSLGCHHLRHLLPFTCRARARCSVAPTPPRNCGLSCRHEAVALGHVERHRAGPGTRGSTDAIGAARRGRSPRAARPRPAGPHQVHEALPSWRRTTGGQGRVAGPGQRDESKGGREGRDLRRPARPGQPAARDGRTRSCDRAEGRATRSGAEGSVGIRIRRSHEVLSWIGRAHSRQGHGEAGRRQQAPFAGQRRARPRRAPPASVARPSATPADSITVAVASPQASRT